MRALTHRLAWTLLWCGVTAGSALALDYRVVGDAAAILYDAPSAKSNKLYVVSQGYPLEVIVTVQGWVKVRDASGTLSWIDARQLSDKRIIMIKVAIAVVRQKPDDAAPVAFQVQQNVLLELIEVSGGWLQVRHRDGASGYVKAQQVWGA